jgi:hypothetical protein
MHHRPTCLKKKPISEPDPCVSADGHRVGPPRGGCLHQEPPRANPGDHNRCIPELHTFDYRDRLQCLNFLSYVLLQILAAPFPVVSCSSPSSQDTGEEPATSLRRQGLCVAPLSAAVASLVSDSARGHGHARADVGGGAFFGAL